MNNKLQILFLIFILGFSPLTKGEIVTTYSVNSSAMTKISEWVDKDTVVFIELDDTLMTPKSRMFSYNSNPHRMFIDNMVKLGKRNLRYNIVIAKWYQQRQVRLVEDAWVEYIQKLQNKGATVYGICNMPLRLLNIEEKRYLESKGLNIIFSNKINGKESLKIEKAGFWGSSFYKGIIFTGPYSESHTLTEFFKITNLVPKKLVFIASDMHVVERVEERLRIFNMDFYNILYLGVTRIPGTPDNQLIDWQQNQLINNGIWMEDEVARAAMNKNIQEEKDSNPN